MRVLLVDDDFMLLKSLKKLLERDHDVRTASDGPTAAQIAVTFRPDVVFVDLLLSWENGLDVIEHLRELMPHAVLVLMSEHPSDVLLQEAISCGANGFLGKEELALIGAFLDQIARSGVG